MSFAFAKATPTDLFLLTRALGIRMIDYDDLELDELVEIASCALQEIQFRLERRNVDAGKVTFPRGFIRTAAVHRRYLPKLGSEVQRRNASYHLMTSDVFRWLAIRTDLSGAALSSIVKEAICIYGVVCDWLLKEATRGHCSRRGFTTRSAKLVELELIDEELKEEIDWIWEIRCNEHFHEVQELEHEKYSRADHNKARKALSNLMKSLGGDA